MRLLLLFGAVLCFAFAMTAAVASQEAYRRALGSDGLWGQGKWGAIVDPKDNYRIIEFVVDDRAKGRAFMIRTVLTGACALTGLFLLVTWINRRPKAIGNTHTASPENAADRQGQP